MKNLGYLLMILVSIFLASCEEEETYPPLSANFTIEDLSQLAQGVKVRFINKSTPFDSCVWDFGNGMVSREINPEIAFPKSGGYVVMLYIYQGKRRSDYGYSIYVRPPFTQQRISKITILEIPFTKPNGKPWDSLPDNELPDIIFQFRTDSLAPHSPDFYQSYSVSENLSRSQLPLVFTPCCMKNWFWNGPDTDAPFYFQLRDDDPNNKSELIASVKIDGSKYPTPQKPYPSQVILGKNGFKIKLDIDWQ